ncbi:MAG: sodium:proton antiporter [Microbacterium sp.]|uniref:cation:proton antiporter n=1 Tax=Microbacterium sp. TaxID=51671 RepID=UPI0039E4B201
MELLLIVVVAVVAIAVVTALAQRLRVAGPLLLVAVGLGVALLPFVDPVELDPEWILIGVLPPLLYSAAVRLPAIEFRRDFRPIAGLSVGLVVVSALALGLFFFLAVPEVGFPLGVALGAILSPTDAVATSIAKRLGLSARVVTLLEGESLLNDATALVLLRTAIVAIAGSFSLWSAVGSFALAVVVAVAVGAIVGYATLRLRAALGNSAASAAISFTVPFLAYVPAEHLGGSGLVAAVVAGIVTGQGSTRWFTAEERLSDHVNWRTVELVLEGGVFLVMGLELTSIVDEIQQQHESLWHGTWLALAALGIVIVIRAGWVSLLVLTQGRRARRLSSQHRERLEQIGARLDKAAAGPTDTSPVLLPDDRRRRVETMRSRVTRMLADIDYYGASPLGWKHGTIIVWAGMRGVVTLAAAQTLPRDTDGRPLLVWVAFMVALLSLMLQGFTLPWLVRRLGLAGSDDDEESLDERTRLDDELRLAAASALLSPGLVSRDGEPFDDELTARMGTRLSKRPDDDDAERDALELRLCAIAAMRTRLRELSSDGTYSTGALRRALAELDADQLSVELRLDG